jgi:hypothetical protein
LFAPAIASIVRTVISQNRARSGSDILVEGKPGTQFDGPHADRRIVARLVGRRPLIDVRPDGVLLDLVGAPVESFLDDKPKEFA